VGQVADIDVKRFIRNPGFQFGVKSIDINIRNPTPILIL